MRPIYKMKIIQIELTNACIHSCSNCTRFCGHHRKPFFMDYKTFVKAVDSMDGFPGMVGIMGGEPTIHPQFEKFIKYYASVTDSARKYPNALNPIRNFSQYLIENDMQNIKCKRGLWSSLGKGYYKHYELIQETFPFQLINDHSHSGLHQTLLVTRKELGIPDDEWIKLRNNCWIQNYWSASITPKGCFFCEIAAALDMLFDGPGGWPIEKGWWKRRPEDFGEQLNWCELCSAVLNVPRVEAALETDVVSPVIYEKLKSIGSPKLEKGGVKILSVEKCSGGKLSCDYSSEWYLPSGDNTKRVSSTNRSLYPKKLDAVIIAGKTEAETHPSALHFDKTVCTMPADRANLSCILDNAFKMLDFNDWVVVFDSSVRLAEDFRRIILSWIFNPGVLYCYNPPSDVELPAGKFCHEDGAPLTGASSEKLLNSSFMMFNKNASNLKTSASIADALFSWPAEKIVMLGSLQMSGDVQRHLELLRAAEKQKTYQMTKHILSFWEELTASESPVALFGAGAHSKWFIGKLRENNLPLPAIVFDDDPDSNSIDGVNVVKTERPFDYNVSAVLVSSDTYSLEMTRRALQIWDGGVKVINPYSDFPDPRFQK